MLNKWKQTLISFKAVFVHGIIFVVESVKPEAALLVIDVIFHNLLSKLIKTCKDLFKVHNIMIDKYCNESRKITLLAVFHVQM